VKGFRSPSFSYQKQNNQIFINDCFVSTIYINNMKLFFTLLLFLPINIFAQINKDSNDVIIQNCYQYIPPLFKLFVSSGIGYAYQNFTITNEFGLQGIKSPVSIAFTYDAARTPINSSKFNYYIGVRLYNRLIKARYLSLNVFVSSKFKTRKGEETFWEVGGNISYRVTNNLFINYNLFAQSSENNSFLPCLSLSLVYLLKK
jgi:hypothetical protein